MAEKVLDVADKKTLDLVYEKLSGTEASLIVKSVRHIQRGIVTSTNTVALEGFTNIDKMVCFVNGGFNGTNNNFVSGAAVISELTVNSLKLTLSNYDNYIKASYQVIEFY